jgi:hypothetical protein
MKRTNQTNWHFINWILIGLVEFNYWLAVRSILKSTANNFLVLRYFFTYNSKIIPQCRSGLLLINVAVNSTSNYAKSLAGWLASQSGLGGAPLLSKALSRHEGSLSVFPEHRRDICFKFPAYTRDKVQSPNEEAPSPIILYAP